ncbi:GNAT family N-acetyltransferase [Loigolactobacillus coryniformis]|uniref:Uncharacterized protein n=3 Tax=Loigolactobacillus coryniformis TaxID=1610 RepID=A0A2D1KNF0_9LACO|nr:GNAT family N-acetyltransferase [Loigolactobacillus coryniformis]ATO43664.1 hypothetical protein LC20004_06955 [Loigolactobacillus coryniformis subsp. torquens DSM 20004 = KCTC 3535]KRK66471.1 hypothetical protein FC16_GL001263 [Loigolactobacillus coryniformis subsp. torquens DSM 20004 = KCTC 3535]
MTLDLVVPTLAYQQQLLVLRREFQQAKEAIVGGNGLAEVTSIAAWLTQLQLYRRGTAKMVPGLTFLALVDQQVVGIINLRLGLNQALRQFGGHIGYSVRPTQRRRGYGRQMLALVLPYAQARGLKRVLLTCATTNIGSQKVITSNGGRLADTVNTTRPTQRYWINLT